MLSVKLFSELSPEAQAARAARFYRPNTVFVTESRPGEGGEPRHFFRRAIYALKPKFTRRDTTAAALKAFALMDIGASVGNSIGRWSQSGGYDPVPDFLELRELAATRLGPVGNESRAVVLLRTAIDAYLSGFLSLTPAQRMRA